MTGTDLALFEAANRLSGASFTLDALMAAALESPLLKGGPIAACFLYAWWRGGNEEAVARRRGILVVTLLTLFVMAPALKLAETGAVSPRPLVRAQTIVLVEDGRLTPLPAIPFRPPQTGLAGELARDAREGTIAENEWTSFPSDHAALFVALGAGIALAAPAAGAVALGWTVLGVLLPRVVTGLHWPSDMAAGGIIGLAVLALALALGRRLLARPLDMLTVWASSHPAWSQPLLFLALLEASEAMETFKRVVEIAGDAVGG